MYAVQNPDRIPLLEKQVSLNILEGRNFSGKVTVDRFGFVKNSRSSFLTHMHVGICVCLKNTEESLSLLLLQN